MVCRGGKIGVVQGVLAAVVAAEVALAAQHAGDPRPAVDVAVGRLPDGRPRYRGVAADPERDRQRRLLGGVSQPFPGLLQQFGPAGDLVTRLPLGEALYIHHRFDGRIVRFQIGPADRPALVTVAGGRVANEPLLVLAEQDVGVDERAAAQTAGDDRLEVGEGPDVEKAVPSLARIPEVRGDFGRRAGERPRWICLSPLEQDDAVARFGETVGGYRTTESRADNHDIRVFVLTHPTPTPAARRLETPCLRA